MKTIHSIQHFASNFHTRQLPGLCDVHVSPLKMPDKVVNGSQLSDAISKIGSNLVISIP